LVFFETGKWGVPQGSLLEVLLFNAATDESGPNVHDRDVFEADGLAPAAEDPSPTVTEADTPRRGPLQTSTPLARTRNKGSRPDDFGTPSRADIRIRNNLREEDRSFRFLPAVRNARRLLNPIEGETTIPRSHQQRLLVGSGRKRTHGSLNSSMTGPFLVK
jgi:hypothetical protein